MVLGWEIVSHSAYSSNIAPTDFHLFRKMQNELSEEWFEKFGKIQKWIDNFLFSLDETFFVAGICKLLVRWLKVIQNGGDYL